MFVRSRGAAILAAATLALGIGVWALAGRAPKGSFDRRPDQNILLITIDTLRADALGSYGGPARTPNLDALAARGTRFDFAHAHAVLTRPSHASILTGTYPYENGVRDHSGYRLKAGMPTIATMLKDNGFETGAFVGGVPLERRFGLDGGFDVYDDRFGRTGNNSDFTLAERPAGEVVDAALKWIGAPPGTLVRLGARVRSARAVRAAAAVRRRVRRAPVLRRGRVRRQGARPAARGRRPIGAADHDRRDRRSRRRAWRSRRADPRSVRLRNDAARAADRRAGRAVLADPRRAACPDYPARHVDIVPTLLDAVGLSAPPALPGRSLLPGAPRVRGRGRLVVLRGDVGDAQSRLGAAPGSRRRAREVHRPADARAVRPRGGSEGAVEPREPPGRPAARARRAASRLSCRAAGRALRRSAGSGGEAPVAGLHVRQRGAQGEVHAKTTTRRT